MGAVVSTAVLVAEGVAALVSGGTAGVAAWATTKLAAMGVRMLTGSGGAVAVAVAERMMKAPGQDYLIPREDFETNPADWFRNHRS